MRNMKRWISLVLTATLVTGSVTLPAMAAESEAGSATTADLSSGPADDLSNYDESVETPDEESAAADEQDYASTGSMNEPAPQEAEEADQEDSSGTESTPDSASPAATDSQDPDFSVSADNDEETTEDLEDGPASLDTADESGNESHMASSAATAATQQETETPLTAEQILAFQERVKIWSDGQHLLITYESGETTGIQYFVYQGNSEDAQLSGELLWNDESDLYSADLGDAGLDGVLRIVLDDGKHRFEETVSAGCGDIETVQGEPAEDYSGQFALTWNNVENAKGYYICVYKSDGGMKTFETAENRFSVDLTSEVDLTKAAQTGDLSSEVESAEEAPAGDLTSEVESGEEAGKSDLTSEVKSVAVAPYSFDDATGVKYFGKAAFYNITTEETTEEATEEPAAEATAREAAAEAITANLGKPAADAASGNTCGENLTWTLGSDGTLTITGTGAMTDFDAKGAPWYDSRSDIRKIVISSGVTTVGRCAFYNCSGVTQVTLPQSLVSIGQAAFMGASMQSTLTLPGSLEKIGSQAFEGATGLKTLTIPDSVTVLGSSVFDTCHSLETITIGDGVTTIPSMAFWNASKLKNITLPAYLKKIDSQAFYKCLSLQNIELPAYLKTIGDMAFSSSYHISEVTIPNSVKTIGYQAFSGCTYLERVTMADSVTTLGSEVFLNCTSLQQVKLSASLTEIPEKAFANCSSLTGISLPDSIKVIGTRAFFACASLTEVILPETMTEICDEAFRACTGLSKVTLPAGDYTAGSNIFTGCANDLKLIDRTTQSETDSGVGTLIPATSKNKGRQDYTRNAVPSTSYLVDEGTRRLRVDYYGDSLVREYYDSANKLISSHSIPIELPVFGGFFEGEDSYYLIFGQENMKQDDSVEVYRIVRYTKDWVRKGAASIRGANTTIPFRSSAASLTESGGMLYIRTSHQTYKSTDNNVHQANVTIVIQKSNMSVTSLQCTSSSISTGYVSHSFNQMITNDGNDLIAVDHGDARPRGIVLFRYAGKAGASNPGNPENVVVMTFTASSDNDENQTGASVGALEISSSHYLIAGNSVDQSGTTCNPKGVRNVFVTATSKSNFTEAGTTTRWITSYTGSQRATTPKMVALPDGRYLLMWTVGTLQSDGSITDPKLSYCFITAAGARSGQIYTTDANNADLSDCQPYVKDNAVWWYVTNENAPLYYYISLSSPGTVHLKNPGHTVTLDPMGGSVSTTTLSVEHGSKYSSLPTPTAPEDGVAFLGWYTNKNGGTQITANTNVRVLDSETLYAHWKTYWTFSEETGTLHYYKPGDMPAAAEPWGFLKGKLRTVIMDDGVTMIGGNQFNYQYTLETAVIPNSVTWIYDCAFNGTSLKDVYYIGTEAEWNRIRIGNYNAPLTRATMHFVDDPYDLKYASVSGLSDKTYTGKAITQVPVVTQVGDILTRDVDYTVSYSSNTNVGTATVKVTGKGAYSGSVTGTFKINAASIANAAVSGLTEQTYTGQAITQTPVLKIGTTTLKAGTDYTVSYSNNVNAGTATVTFTGKGNYKGTANSTFVIKPASVSGASVSGLSAKTYTGKAQSQSPVVVLNGVTLVKNTDYTLSYSNNVNAGTATVKITGKGNYTGTVSKSFTIKPASISGAVISGLVDMVYSGDPIEQSPEVKVGNVVIAAGTDYVLTYKDNVNAGTATVTVTGKGNYTGSAEAAFTILKVDQALTVKITAARFANGHSATVTVTGGKTALTFESSDAGVATVSEEGVVTGQSIGTAEITVKAAGSENYNEAAAKISVRIVPAATASVTAANLPTSTKVNWKMVEGATGYYVYRDGVRVATIDSGSTVTYIDRDAITNGTKYTFKIVAFGATGSSTLSRSVVIYRLSKAAISSVRSARTGEMTVTWKKNAAATGYYVQYSKNDSFTAAYKTVTVDAAAAVSKVLTGLTPGKNYYVRVRAFKTVGSKRYLSTWSAVKSVKVAN